MKRILCFIKGHKRGKTYYKGDHLWHVECIRCGFVLEYKSPMCRLLGIEIMNGFDGE